jgi:hypothetical protein
MQSHLRPDVSRFRWVITAIGYGLLKAHRKLERLQAVAT